MSLGKKADKKTKVQRTLWGSALAYKLVLTALSIGLAGGIALMLYPYAQRLKFAYLSARNSDLYVRTVTDENAESVRGLTAKQEFQLALEYNRRHTVNLIAESAMEETLGESGDEEYDKLLNFLGDGMMGVLEIPKIGERLCIYHGTDETTLLRGVGHIAGSSLPAGGESTHCVLSGHRGLAAARLLTNLDQMEEGDRFYLHVLGEDLAYEVDQILVVLPTEIASLQIAEGEDLCTLVTCTPYAVNTHRLLVRGHRIPYEGEKAAMPAADTLRWLTPGRIAAIAAGILALLIAVLVLRRRRRKKQTE